MSAQGAAPRPKLRDGTPVGTGETAFDGVTGRIAFDRFGDVPAKPVVIGVVRSGQLVTERAP